MIGHHVDPAAHAFGEHVVGDLLDDQRAEKFGRLVVSALPLRLRPDQRQHGDQFGMGLVGVGLDRLFDLRRQIGGVAGVPKSISAGDDNRSQFAQQRRRCWSDCPSSLAR